MKEEVINLPSMVRLGQDGGVTRAGIYGYTTAQMLGAIQTERAKMEALRVAVCELMGYDPGTWPDHGNVPLAIAATLGIFVYRRPLPREKLSEIAREAQIAFCLDKFSTFEEAFARGIERAHHIEEKK